MKLLVKALLVLIVAAGMSGFGVSAAVAISPPNPVCGICVT